MRYDQINQISNGDAFKLLEDYECKTEMAAFTLYKGTRLVVISQSPIGFWFKLQGSSIPVPFTFSKKRLHKMKMRKIGTVHL